MGERWWWWQGGELIVIDVIHEGRILFEHKIDDKAKEDPVE